MGKLITSPVVRFPGTVEVSDPLNMLQVLAWEKAFREAQAIKESGYLSDLNAAYLPALLSCIDKWNIKGVPDKPTVETFPFSPRLPSAELISWLIGEISAVYVGETEESKND